YIHRREFRRVGVPSLVANGRADDEHMLLMLLRPHLGSHERERLNRRRRRPGADNGDDNFGRFAGEQVIRLLRLACPGTRRPKPAKASGEQHRQRGKVGDVPHRFIPPCRLPHRFYHIFVTPQAGAFFIPGRDAMRGEMGVDIENGRTLAQSIIAAAGTMATYLWGGWDAVIMALVVMVVLDYVTGLTASWVHGRLDSDRGRRGIVRKVGIFVAVAVANVIDQTGGLGEPVLRTVVVWFY